MSETLFWTTNPRILAEKSQKKGLYYVGLFANELILLNYKRKICENCDRLTSVQIYK